MIEHFGAHRDYLCEQQGWSDDSEKIQAMVSSFKAKQCKAAESGCP
jgi:hypothetical protein